MDHAHCGDSHRGRRCVGLHEQPCNRAGRRGGLVRRARLAGAAGSDDHPRSSGDGRRFRAAGSQPRARERFGEASAVLPRRRDAEAVERLRHQDGSLAAGRRTGTASSRRSATARSTATSPTPRWRRRWRAATRRARPTPAIPAAAPSFALGHPEKVDRLRMARGARDDRRLQEDHRRLLRAAPPKYSYWNGCSAGGRQAMKAAQRFPADFDGIIAGAPGLDWTGRAAQAAAGREGARRTKPRACPQPQRQLLHRPWSRRATRRRREGRPASRIRSAASSIPPCCNAKAATSATCLTASASRDGATDLLGRGEPEDQTRDHRPRARAASWDGPTWAGRRQRARPGSISSASSSSAIRAGTCRSSTSTPTSCAPRKWTTTRSMRSIRT